MTSGTSYTDGDKKWIQDAIRAYDRKFPTGPDSIAMCVISAQQEIRDNEIDGTSNSKTGVIQNSTSGRRPAFAMPENLYTILKFKYPKLFQKPGFLWFKRNFPMFWVGK